MANVKNKPLLDMVRQRGKLTAAVDMLGLPEVTFNLEEDFAHPDTEIFMLSPEVALAATKMVDSSSFRLPDLKQLRFPYPRMAIEIPLTEDIKNMRRNADNPINGSYEITRLGLLIQSNHEDGWINCIPYWEYEDTKLIECPLLSYVFGLDDLPAPAVALVIPQDISNPVHLKVIPSVIAMNAFKKANVPAENFATIFKHPLFTTYLEENVVELPVLLFACNLLLNCKTGVKRTPIAAKTPPIGLKLGAKKKKEHSASRYTMLHLEEIETVGIDGSISLRADVAAHYVRGHFKQRQSGLYWWNPFVRGKGEPTKRVAYLTRDNNDNQVVVQQH